MEERRGIRAWIVYESPIFVLGMSAAALALMTLGGWFGAEYTGGADTTPILFSALLAVIALVCYLLRKSHMELMSVSYYLSALGVGFLMAAVLRVVGRAGILQMLLPAVGLLCFLAVCALLFSRWGEEKRTLVLALTIPVLVLIVALAGWLIFKKQSPAGICLAFGCLIAGFALGSMAYTCGLGPMRVRQNLAFLMLMTYAAAVVLAIILLVIVALANSDSDSKSSSSRSSRSKSSRSKSSGSKGLGSRNAANNTVGTGIAKGLRSSGSGVEGVLDAIVYAPYFMDMSWEQSRQVRAERRARKAEKKRQKALEKEIEARERERKKEEERRAKEQSGRL